MPFNQPSQVSLISKKIGFSLKENENPKNGHPNLVRNLNKYFLIYVKLDKK